MILVANQTDLNVKPTWTKNGDTWTYVFKDVAVNENGSAIDYSVKELPVEKYTTKIEGLTITNSYDPAVEVVSGTKTWVDGGNQDGIRPDAISIVLIADGVDQTVEPTWNKSGDVWTYTFANLPKNQNGTPITYDVKELPVANYETTKAGRDFVNTYSPRTRNIEGTKTWVDGNNQDGIRPDTITVTLMADDNDLALTPVWTKTGNVWNYVFENVPVNKSGNEITYTVKEAVVTGYDSEINGFNITNTYLPQVRTVTGTKFWNDGNNQDNKRPSEIIIKLFADGVERTATPEWTRSANTWTYTFKNLPLKSAGNLINYTIQEVKTGDYTATLDGLNLTNSRAVDLRDVTGTKTWVDGNNQDGIRPETLELILSADGVALPNLPTWVKNGNVWTYTFADVAVNANGSPINYTVSEKPVEGYELTTEGLNLTNTHVPGVTTIKGTKVWDDANNQDGIRPESIQLVLMADGVDQTYIPTWSQSENSWDYTFENLPTHKDGKLITYTVKEKPVVGYTTTIDEFVITNTHIPETYQIVGTKVWIDDNNQAGMRPEDITITLYADGVAIATTPEWKKDGNVWNFTFENMPKYHNGKEISYSVTEAKVDNYTTTIEGFEVTNTYIKPIDPVNPVKPETKLPATGMNNSVPYVGFGSVILGSLFLALSKEKRKKDSTENSI